MLDLSPLRHALAPRYTIDRSRLDDAAPLHRLTGRASDGAPITVTLLAPRVAEQLLDPGAVVKAVHDAASLRHPALASVLESGVTAAGEPYYVVAGAADGSARERVDAAQPLPARAVAHAGARIADALEAVHSAGSLHGAVLPASLLWIDGEPVLADFGLFGGLLNGGLVPTAALNLLGARGYAAPEMLLGEPNGRSDVYALGATLYELLTGKPPFGGRTTMTTMATVLADEPSVESTAGHHVPGQVVDSLLRAIEKIPDDRWPSAAAFAAALRAGEVARGETPDASLAAAPRYGCLPSAVIFVLYALGVGRGA